MNDLNDRVTIRLYHSRGHEKSAELIGIVADNDDVSMRKRRKRKPKRGIDEGRYVCPECGELIVIPIDPSAGAEQQYVEDCPVCCHPNIIHVEFFAADEPARLWAEGE